MIYWYVGLPVTFPPSKLHTRDSFDPFLSRCCKVHSQLCTRAPHGSRAVLKRDRKRWESKLYKHSAAHQPRPSSHAEQSDDTPSPMKGQMHQFPSEDAWNYLFSRWHWHGRRSFECCWARILSVAASLYPKLMRWRPLLSLLESCMDSSSCLLWVALEYLTTRVPRKHWFQHDLILHKARVAVIRAIVTVGQWESWGLTLWPRSPNLDSCSLLVVLSRSDEDFLCPI